MKKRRRANDLSRREFLNSTIIAGTTLYLNPPSAETTCGEPLAGGASPANAGIHVSPPAGPPPYGVPVETSVPFVQGHLYDLKKLAVFAPDEKSVIAQFRPALRWPDGSIRWLAVAFEAATGPGDYVLGEGASPQAPDLVRQEEGRIVVETGELALHISESRAGWMELQAAAGAEGEAQPVVTVATAGDLILTRHDGKVFRASLDGETRRVVVEERGPVRVRIGLEGKCRAADGESLFDFAIRCTAFRARPEVCFEYTWINSTDNPSEQLRDIRVSVPFEFAPERLVIGCETGVYDGPFLKGWPVYILQEDHNSYWAKTLNLDGRMQNLSSGGCNGEHCPGWLYFLNQDRCLALWVPNFWEEYPNEIAVRQGELSVGLWPERAIGHLVNKPVLPANPQGEKPYAMTKYWPILPHPYWAFLDPEKRCLDVRQGMAKTQSIVLSVWAGRGEAPAFEKKWWARAIVPVRGHLDPGYVSSTQALGPMQPRDVKNFREFERLFDESFGWLNRHTDLLKCYGKFDYGDFKYFTASTTYMCHPGTKWGEMGEMAREGYWHNNERDPLLGLLLYYFRTGDPAAWERCRIVARHLLDVDIRHHPHWGMWTHSYGHCYVALGEGGEPDHSWLLGMLAWAGASGDPMAWDWAIRCGEHLREFKADLTQTDARTAAVFLHMMCQFYQYTGQTKYLDSAQPVVAAFLKLQSANGSWPVYLASLEKPQVEGFVEHAVMALADYYSITGDARVLASLDKALAYLYGTEGHGDREVGEAPLALYALAILREKTGQARYADLAGRVLSRLCVSQNLSSDPVGRGDLMAEWGVNNPEAAKGSGRPPQFVGQTRPLAPACVLAYGQPALAALASTRQGRK